MNKFTKIILFDILNIHDLINVLPKCCVYNTSQTIESCRAIYRFYITIYYIEASTLSVGPNELLVSQVCHAVQNGFNAIVIRTR